MHTYIQPELIHTHTFIKMHARSDYFKYAYTVNITTLSVSQGKFSFTSAWQLIQYEIIYLAYW